MNKKALIIIFFAILSGIISVFLVNQYIKSQEDALYRGMEMIPVIVAVRDIESGTHLQAELLAKRNIPRKYVHGNTVSPEDVNLILGQSLNFPLKKGDPLLWSDLGGEIESLRGLSGMITKGERALSIPVDTVGGVSGLLKPNDHIDILCTIRNKDTGEDATITLLQNITILAAGRSLPGSEDSFGGYGTLTLLVTLQEAELLVFAQEHTKLVVMLRHPEDIETHKDIPKVTFSNIMKDEYREKIQKRRDEIIVIKKGRVSN